MNEQALDDELVKPEYTGLTDQQAAAAVNDDWGGHLGATRSGSTTWQQRPASKPGTHANECLQQQPRD
jgi:hypothetical protein